MVNRVGIVVAMVVGMAALCVTAAAEDAACIGSQKCMKCHFKQHATWKKEKHAAAYETIAKEADKDLCVSCHTTGYGKGGFKDMESTPELANVGCESCHGPGSKHAAAMDEIKKAGGEATDDAKALITKTPTTCSNCHNPHVQDTAAEARSKK